MDPRTQAALIAEREAGNRAKRLIEELAPHLDTLEARVMTAWREDARTPETREEAWHRLKALDMLRAELGRLIEGGGFAEKRLAKN